MKSSSNNISAIQRAGGTVKERAVSGITLVLIGGLLLISQTVILLTFNLIAYLSLPTLNPQSLSASIVLGIETFIAVPMVLVSISFSRRPLFGIRYGIFSLISIVIIILLDGYMTIPSMNGPSIQILIQVLSVLFMPADNYIMGAGIILVLIGSVLTILRLRKVSRNLSFESVVTSRK